MATNRRFVVNNIGHAYAVHDTQRTYQRMEGEERSGAAPTSNVYTSRIVETCSTRAVAQKLANQLNEVWERERRAS